LSALWNALGLVFAAELGDKTQLLTLAYATRFSTGVVVGGVAAAVMVLNALAVAAGSLLGRLPERAVGIGAGLLFIGFAVWTLLDREDEEDAEAHAEEEAEAEARRGRPGFVTVAGGFFVAELGDKTQLATAALAARGNPLAVWAGATLGMLAADGLAIVVGRIVGKRLPQDVLRYIAAALFAVFGVWLLVDAIT